MKAAHFPYDQMWDDPMDVPIFHFLRRYLESPEVGQVMGNTSIVLTANVHLKVKVK